MAKLYILMAVSIGLAWLYENTYLQTPQGPQKSRTIYAFLVAILICFAGFRGAYNDTWNYRTNYVYLVKGFPDAWETFSWNLGDNPAYELIQAWFKTYNTDVHLLLMFFAVWTILIYMAFLRRFSTNLALTIYFFFTMGCYVFTLAAIKQCMATAFCLLAIPCALKKQWIPFILMVFLGMLFHPYAAMYLITPFLTFKPWSKASYWLLAAFLLGGILFQPLLENIIDITTAIGEEYTESTFSGSGVGTLRVLVCWSPILLSFVYKDVLFDDSSKAENLIMNLSFVFSGIIFMGLFGTALYFGRLSYYFLPSSVVSLAWMLHKLRKKISYDSVIITSAAMFLYFIFFYFSNTVENDFAGGYAALSPLEFLKILVEALKGGSA